MRTLSFPKLLNARDLGGHATLDGGRTRHGFLLRADDLYQATADGAQAIVDYGVRTVIDLRWPEERSARPSVFERGFSGVRYCHISLLGSSESAWRGLCPGVAKEVWNCAVLERAQSEIAAVVQVIAEASSHGVLFHCVAGKDRTGLIAALLLRLAEADPRAIARDYAVSTEHLREAYLGACAVEERETMLENVRCPPEQVYNMLDFLDRRGGVAAYLAAAGVSDPVIEQIKARLRLAP